MRVRSPEDSPGCLNMAGLGLLAFFVLKAAIGAAPAVHVREERAELAAQMDAQIASGELNGRELYEETFIRPHIATDGGTGIAGWLAPDDERDVSPRYASVCLAFSPYNPVAGADVRPDGNTVTVDPTGTEPTIRIIMDDELFGVWQPADEVTDDRLSAFLCPTPPEDL